MDCNLEYGDLYFTDVLPGYFMRVITLVDPQLSPCCEAVAILNLPIDLRDPILYECPSCQYGWVI